jgi:hypothetical protein
MAVIGVTLAGGAVVVLARTPDPVVTWGARVGGGLAVLAGVGLIVAGVFAV